MSSHNKPVIFETDLSHRASSLNFTQEKFLQSIDKHGYDIHVERAMRCPCANVASGSPLLSCQNCGGSGWIFINKRETRAVMQYMNSETKFREWTEENSGRVSISFRPNEDIAFMDRITDLNKEATYSQTINLQNVGSDSPEWVGTFIYYPLKIINAFLFVADVLPLRQINEQNHFFVEDNKIRITDNSIFAGLENPNDPVITVRFHHRPTYHILDITRERVASREKNCETGRNELKDLPIHSIAMRAHEMLDRPDVRGVGLIDNTFVSEGEDF